MTDFDLARVFDGAVSPINTLLHLKPDKLRRHLEVMAPHLKPKARYLVQVGLVDPDQREPFAGSHWEAKRGDTRLRIEWVDEELDIPHGRSRQRSRIEVLEGPRAGEIIEEVHDMTVWTPDAWQSTLSKSPFTAVAMYDGGQEGRPRVASTTTGGLLWHELENGSMRHFPRSE
jgi:hypothetical protein